MPVPPPPHPQHTTGSGPFERTHRDRSQNLESMCRSADALVGDHQGKKLSPLDAASAAFANCFWKDPPEYDNECGIPLEADLLVPDASLDASKDVSLYGVTPNTLGLAQAGAIEAVVNLPIPFDALPVVKVDMNKEDDGNTFEIATVTETEERTMANTLVQESPYGYSDPRPGAVRKHVLMNRLLLHLLGSGIISFRPGDYLPGEKENGVVRVLHPDRPGFDVGDDEVKFNEAFRALQSSGHPDWMPQVKAVGATTTAVTQQWDAVGWGPDLGTGAIKAAPWTIHNGGIRGPAETDPQGASGKRKRDGLYYKRFVYDPARSKKKYVASHLFRAGWS